MNKNKFYITTTLPYVNAEPHIGFALEIIRADAWVRFMRSRGNEVFFNTGTDEHGQKVFQRAQELGLETQTFCDQLAENYRGLKKTFNLSYDNFIRTTDKRHIEAAQEFWRQSKANGHIYKKPYKIKYCVGCELEKTESELEDGKCLLHPNLEIEIIEEENYFFKFSEFQKKLLQLYKENPEFVVPAHRFNEIKKFVENGLEDFSISRLKTKMPWGIEVPDDKEHVMYVWFDALINYISAIGWPDDLKKFNKWWPAVQVAGKDNIRQQSAMWQTMLMSVGLAPSKQIFINSFITSAGQKMSKSLGNVISPNEMVEKFGPDGTRWLLLSLNTFGDDMNLTWEGMAEKYNADLANGLGNLLERVFTLIIKNNISLETPFSSEYKNYDNDMENMRFSDVVKKTTATMKELDHYLDKKQPWKNIVNPIVLNYLFSGIENILEWVEPFMPVKTKQAKDYIERVKNKEVGKEERLGLFPRITP